MTAPEALRLAEALDHIVIIDEVSSNNPLAKDSAAELRRLHAENEALKRIIENCKVVSDATAEGWRLDQEKFEATAALNAELLEALKGMPWPETSSGVCHLSDEWLTWHGRVKGALRRAEGKE